MGRVAVQKPKFFGTDGIRGPVDGPILNESWVRAFGYALGAYGARKANGKPLTVIIGRDTRESGSWIHDLLLEGLNAHQGLVYSLGVVPTPAVAYAVVRERATLGVVITASHNPASDNGIKIFNAFGHKLDIEEELLIESGIDPNNLSEANLSLRQAYPMDGLGAYITHMRSLCHQKCFRDFKIVVDCSHGATSESTPRVLKHFGAEVVLINAEPDVTNINVDAGSEYPQKMAERVVAEGADLGIAHDGDGDRVVFADAQGCVIPGEQILGLLVLRKLQNKKLNRSPLVTTVQSNLGLDKVVTESGGSVVRSDVGDRNVAALMRASGSLIGGENSGHYIIGDYSTTGDGLMAAIEVLRILDSSSETLGELASRVSLFPQVTSALKVHVKPPLEELVGLQKAITEQNSRLAGSGRVMIRYSGTEPKLRFLVEAETLTVAEDVLQKLELSAASDFSKL